MPDNPDSMSHLIRSVREVLIPYGRDYAIGAMHGLAVRNMVSVSLPSVTEGFYPIVKVHEMALGEVEELFYRHLQESGSEAREGIINRMVEEKVWE
jgi:hypothetical protein